MIISASRRTDIPNYYSDWLFSRLQEQYVLVRNPMNIHQVSKISLAPDVVDCIVFWTKNPAPMMDKLDRLKDYSYYFQFTLNSYGKDIEPNVSSKNDELIYTFQRLSDKIGSNKVIWRYDPIFINEKYTLDYHITYFERLAYKLKGYTNRCTVSFIDLYKNTKTNSKSFNLCEMSIDLKRKIAESFSQIADSFGFSLDTCAEDIDLSAYNISHAKCIDTNLIESITNTKLGIVKDKGQRLACGCVESIDIGMYNTCLNGCKYCYANYSINTVDKNSLLHDKNSPLLCGQLSSDDKVRERKIKSFKDNQIHLFDK